MKQDLYFNMNYVSASVDWMKFYVIKNKNGMIMNVGVNVKN